MSTEGVEAIVVEYRSPQRTITCIETLLAHGVSLVHVIDNSDDRGKTRAVIQEAFPTEARIKLLDSGGNRGFAAAVNAGMLRCTSPFALLINNDAIPELGSISALRKTLLENPRALISFPSLTHAGRPLGRVFYHPWLTTLTGRKLPGSYEVPRGCCMMIATQRFRETLFDERFFMYGEELQLGWRLRNMSAALAWTRTALVTHEGSASSVRGSAFYEERTALAHILIGQDIAEQHSLSSTRGLLRSSALLLRAAIRSARQRSLTPLRALAAARRHATGGPPLTPPPGNKPL